MQAIGKALEESNHLSQKNRKKGKREKQKRKTRIPYVCACFALRNVVVALLLFSHLIRSRKEEDHHPKYAIITAAQDSPLAPRFDEERHARKEKSKERKKNSAKKGCVERQERKSEVSHPRVAPFITEEEKKKIVSFLCSVVVSCLRSGVDLAHPSIALERGRKTISSVHSSSSSS